MLGRALCQGTLSPDGLSVAHVTLDEACRREYQQIRQSLISRQVSDEPIISDTDTSAIQNEPVPGPAYHATFSSEGSMAYLAGGGTLATIIVPD